MKHANAKVILFEYPLNEKMRTWLRLEFLLKYLRLHTSLNEIKSALSFFQILSNLLNLLERGDIRIAILKELHRQQQRLLIWENMPDVDDKHAKYLRITLKHCATQLISIPRLGQLLKDDRLIGIIRQRLLIPGGCCNFDLPELHIWLNLPQIKRDEQISSWLQVFNPIYLALEKIMNITRSSGTFKKQTCLCSIFRNDKDNEDNELLRLLIPSELMIYPKILVHKNHYIIHFLSINNENNEIPNKLIFSLSCC